MAKHVATCHVVHRRVKKGSKENGVNKCGGVIGRYEDRGIGLYTAAVVQVNLAEQKPINHMDKWGKE